MTTEIEIQRLVASEFQRRGWAYDLEVGRAIATAAAERGSTLDYLQLADSVPSYYLQKNGVSRRAMEQAIARALSEVYVPGIESSDVASVIIHDNRYSVTIQGSAHVQDSSIGNHKVLVNETSSKSDVLSALEVLLRAALGGQFYGEAFQALERSVSDLDSVSFEDVERVSRDVASAHASHPQRLREFLQQVSVNALGGAVGTGLVAGVSSVLSHVP